MVEIYTAELKSNLSQDVIVKAHSTNEQEEPNEKRALIAAVSTVGINIIPLAFLAQNVDSTRRQC